MALPRLPASVVAEYVGGNHTAISQRLLDVAKTNPGEVRAAAEQGARAVALHYCEHMDPPDILACYNTKAEARQAAEVHPGLCGVQLSWLIASVRIQHVLDRGLQPTATKLRNQACYDAAKAMNAHGSGVQLKRCECFTQGCRAIWPGAELLDDDLKQAFL